MMAKDDRKIHVVELQKGEYAPLPATQNHVLLGPGRLEITRRSDGRVYGQILEGTTAAREWALRHKLKRIGWDI